MKQIALLFTSLLIVASAFAQTDSTHKKKKDWSKVSLSNRPNDHFMVQIGFDGWAQVPDTIKIKGFSHSVNVYFMLDFPFKTDPRFSVGLGAGVGSSNIKFDKQEVDIINTGNKLPFPNKADTTHFKKYKLVSAYLEAPVELRFATNPENSDKSWKIALGIKVGALVNVHTRGKTLQNSTGGTLNNYVLKENSKRFFNGTRFCATARFGYGHISLFGQYQINTFIRDGQGPAVHPYSIGINLSGL
jgi:Outer membrane protein beta-barrel domain